jgi:hypothetical protein
MAICKRIDSDLIRGILDGSPQYAPAQTRSFRVSTRPCNFVVIVQILSVPRSPDTTARCTYDMSKRVSRIRQHSWSIAKKDTGGTLAHLRSKVRTTKFKAENLKYPFQPLSRVEKHCGARFNTFMRLCTRPSNPGTQQHRRQAVLVQQASRLQHDMQAPNPANPIGAQAGVLT